MSKISGQLLISGQFQDICKILGISGQLGALNTLLQHATAADNRWMGIYGDDLPVHRQSTNPSSQQAWYRGTFLTEINALTTIPKPLPTAAEA